MRIALFQPDIPQNAATILRTAACLGVATDIIEPCGFVFGDRQFRRAGMDYLALAAIERFASWHEFVQKRRDNRLVLLTTRSDMAYFDFGFAANDVLIVGQESAGVPEAVHAAVDARLRIPMIAGARSLNVAVAAGMVIAEALRQTQTCTKEETG
jgi:tRNA (cytidine/uridine-2'-O-)-methyltransferase